MTQRGVLWLFRRKQKKNISFDRIQTQDTLFKVYAWSTTWFLHQTTGNFNDPIYLDLDSSSASSLSLRCIFHFGKVTINVAPDGHLIATLAQSATLLAQNQQVCWRRVGRRCELIWASSLCIWALEIPWYLFLVIYMAATEIISGIINQWTPKYRKQTNNANNLYFFPSKTLFSSST